MSTNAIGVAKENYTRKPGRRGKALTPERAFEIDNADGTDEELSEKFQCSIATVKNARRLADIWRFVLNVRNYISENVK